MGECGPNLVQILLQKYAKWRGLSNNWINFAYFTCCIIIWADLDEIWLKFHLKNTQNDGGCQIIGSILRILRAALSFEPIWMRFGSNFTSKIHKITGSVFLNKFGNQVSYRQTCMWDEHKNKIFFQKKK
jgi:hypothetical protein